jgi:hypothetical protein
VISIAMENTQNQCSGGVIIGIISLAENLIKATISIGVLLVGIPFIAKGENIFKFSKS